MMRGLFACVMAVAGSFACRREAATPPPAQAAAPARAAGDSATYPPALTAAQIQACGDSAASWDRLDCLRTTCGNSVGNCAAALHDAQIALAAAFARATDSTLSLRLEDGSWVQLGPDTSNWKAHYEFHARIPEHHLFVVHTQYYEGDGYVLVDSRNGKRTYLDDYPVLAPNRKRLAVASGDLEVDYNPRSLTILGLADDAPVVEWRADSVMQDWVAADPVWISDTVVTFTRLSLDSLYQHIERKGAIRLVRTAGTWQLDTLGARP